MRDPDHQQKVFNGPIGTEMFKLVSDKMEVTPLSTVYLGTRQVNLREARNVKTPADLKGIMAMLSGDAGWLRVRAPLVALTAEEYKALEKTITAFGIDTKSD